MKVVLLQDVKKMEKEGYEAQIKALKEEIELLKKWFIL